MLTTLHCHAVPRWKIYLVGDIRQTVLFASRVQQRQRHGTVLFWTKAFLNWRVVDLQCGVSSGVSRGS